MSAVVLRGDHIIAQGVAGVRRKGSPELVTLDDQFEICSCGKAMTATLVAMVVEEGKLNWDTPLSEIFADSEQPIDPAWKQATLWQVLTHRAGLRDHLVRFLASTFFDSGDFTARRRRFAEKLLRHPPSSPPGSTFVYSNADYIVATAAIEKVTGRAWEDLMRERLFAPLGITTGGFGPPGTPGRVDEPWGHGRRPLIYFDRFGKGDAPFDPGSSSADVPLVWAPVGLVHMSAPDWAKFVAWHLRGDRANPQQKASLLTSETFARLHEAAIGEEYAGGWLVGTRPWAKGARPGDTGRVLFHVGDNGRWNCVVWIAPEIDFAIVIACNRTHMWSALDEAAGVLLRTFAERK